MAAVSMRVAAVSTTRPDRAGTELTPAPFPAPFPGCPGIVRPEWIDHNGHLNLAYYIVLFDAATDALWHAIGLGEPYRLRTGCGTFAVETHTLYLAELREGEDTRSRSFVVDLDAKRIHVAHDLLRARDGVVAARQELLYLTVNLQTRRSVPWPAETLVGLEAAADAHRDLRPDWVGRRVAIPPRRPA